MLSGGTRIDMNELIGYVCAIALEGLGLYHFPKGLPSDHCHIL